MLRIRVCGGLEVEADGRPLPDALVGGRQGRLVLAYLVCERPRAVKREELAELLWTDRLPDSWSASLSAVISRLRRLFTEAGLDGAATITAEAGAYQLLLPEDAVVDLDELEAAVEAAEAAAERRDAAAATDAARTAEGIGGQGFLKDDCEWVDRQREAVRDLRVRATLALSEAHLGAGASARAVDAARDALALDEMRESAFRQLMRALAAAGERGEALRVWERCRTALVEELGVDPSPASEAVYVEILEAGTTPTPAPTTTALPSGVVTFLLTDIVDSSALWDKAPDAMAVALERHDSLIAEVVADSYGTLLKSKLEGDATVSVFARASDGAAAALALQDALAEEPWPEGAQPRLRMAMHTGEAFERGGDYFGPALNRAARLRGLAGPGEVLLSQAVAELVRDHLPVGGVLRSLGHRDLRGLSRGENVYSLVRGDATALEDVAAPAAAGPGALVPPPLPAALSSSAPFVGRGNELTTLTGLWDSASSGTQGAAFIGGEPGVGKSRLAGEIAAHAHAAGAIVLYGRCDEELAAPLQPFLEALRSLVPTLGAERVASVRGVDELARVVPELAELLPDRAPAVRADPDTERLALFDAVTNIVTAASAEVPVLLVLDDLHWAGKTTLSLLRHLLRGAKGARLLVVGTYRDTELARTHPLSETLADLRRDADATRVSLSGLAAEDIEAYLSAIGIDDRALGRELAEVTSGNPFFLIEVVRHVEETGGSWSPGNLPEGVREATGRRLSRLSDATNQALSVAAVVGATFDLALVEQAQGGDLVEQIDEACRAGLVVEEPGAIGRFRFAHALVRQVLLAELVTVKRVRMHKAIAELLEARPGSDDADTRLADLAYHWSECASLGDAAKAVDACRRAADRAMERLAYEEAGDLYGMALQVLDDDDPDSETRATLHLARCDALLTAGDVAGARDAIDALEGAAGGSERLAAWYTTYEGLLAVLAEPDRLTEIVQSIGAAAGAMRAIGDLRGEARAHYVHASALERLGQIGAAERALDAALAAARTADDRRLADSILAEAPPAALWGPSSVTRASGRCLDVVRVLRINDGAPAVESVALRCQAVLEALRGRSDAARKMIASARRTVERLGLAHRQLETEVMAGFIELIAGDAPEAERLLRYAYEGLRARGLGGEAAQAAAFLGRALLLQDRVDEADEIAAESEALAGSDLKAAIAWRDVRAECAARRGDAARALALASEAVELAAATDALLLVVDARLTLATVLRATGDHAGADDEARRAVEACDAKGATALAARARGDVVATSEDRTKPSTPAASPAPHCAAFEAALVWTELFNRGAIDEIVRLQAPELRAGDRRPLLEAGAGGDAAKHERNLVHTYDADVRFDPPELLVARGHLALVRWNARSPRADWSFLVVFGVDGEGRTAEYVLFDPDQRNAANVELDRLTVDEAEVENAAWRTVRRYAAATNAKDWDGLLALYAPGYELEDRKIAALEMPGPEELNRTLFALDDFAREVSAIEVHGDRRVLFHHLLWFRDGAVADAEFESLHLIEIDDAGLILRTTNFDPDDLVAARAELHRRREPTQETLAVRTARRFVEAVNAHDWDGVTACIARSVSFLDRRRAVTAPDSTLLLVLDMYRTLFSMDDWSIDRTFLGTNGDRRVLVQDLVRFRTRDVSEGEIEAINVYEVDALGRVVHMVSFDAEDLDAARAELHRYDGVDEDHPGWRVLRRMADAVNAHDWDDFHSVVGDGWPLVDGRGAVSVPGSGDPIAEYELLFSMDDWTTERRLVQTHGLDCVLVRDVVRFQIKDVADSEVESLNVFAVSAAGRIIHQVRFGPDDLDAARAELFATPSRFADNLAARAVRRFSDAINAHDWDALIAVFAPGARQLDRRSWISRGDVVDPVEMHRTLFALDDWSTDDRLLETHGDRRALVRRVTRFRDGASGWAEVATLTVDEVDAVGRLTLHIGLDPDDLEAARAELRSEPAVPPPRENDAWQAALRMKAASDAKDWDAFVACFAADYEYRSERPSVQLHLVGQQAPFAYRTLFELEDWTWERSLLASRGEAAVLVLDDVTFVDGVVGPGESSSLCVVEIGPAGTVVRSIAFELDELDAAMAELEARAARTAATRFENEAWRAETRMWEACVARDRDALVATLADGFETHDHRRAVQLHLTGEEALATYQLLLEMDEVTWERTLRATRGEHLALTQERFTVVDRAAGDAETVLLSVITSDPDGRLQRTIVFNEDDLDAAFEEMDRQYAEQGGPDQRGYVHAYTHRDSDELRSFFRPDAVVVDHRWAGFGRIDRESFVAYAAGPVDPSPGERFSIDHVVAAHPRGHVAVATDIGRHGDSEYEVSLVSVTCWDEDERTIALHLFDLDHLDDAVRTLEEFVARTETPSFENAAWRAGMRMRDACVAQDRERFLTTLADGFEYHDNRSAVQLHLYGEDAPKAHDSIFPLDEFTWDRTLRGTRGDHVALVEDRITFADQAAGEAEITTLTVLTSAPSGRVLRSVAFAEDDVAAAYDELDRQYVERDGPDMAPYRHALAARDWPRFRRFFAPDAVIADHGSSGFGELGPDEYVEYLAETHALTTDFRMLVDHVPATSPTASFVVGRTVGSLDGGHFELEHVTISQHDETGRIDRLDIYTLEHLDEAWAHYDRLVADDAGHPRANAAYRAQLRLEAAFNAQDFEQVRAALSAGFTYHDRRSTMLVDASGEEALSVFRVGVDLDDFHLTDELLEVRGDRLALIAQTAVFQDGASGPAEISTLTVVESDAEGLMLCHVVFEATARDDALAELEARDAASSTVVPNRAWTRCDRLRVAFNAQDFERIQAALSPDFTYQNRRSTITAVELCGDDAVAMYRAAMDLDDFRLQRRLVTARGDHLVLAEEVAEFSSGASGPARIEALTVFEVDAAGLLVAHVAFDVSAMAEALAELDARWRERQAEPTPLPNAAWEVVLALDAASDAADWEAFRALLHDDYQAIDHRTVVSNRVMAAETYEVLFSLDEWQLRHVLLDTRGDRLVLVRTTVWIRDGDTGPAEIPVLTLFEIAPDGRILSETGFDVEDLDRATAALDARWDELQAEPGSAEGNLSWRTMSRISGRTGDFTWDQLASHFHPDNVWEDRRRGLRLLETQNPLHAYRTLLELDEWELRRDLVATRGEHLALLRTLTVLRDGNSGPAEVETLAVNEVAPDGRIIRQVIFEPDDLDAATAELDRRWAELLERQRLLEDPLTIPRNLAVRSVAKPGWVLLAALGEHLCLHDTGERLILHEVDDRGEVTVLLAYDRADRPRAAGEMAQRAYERAGVPMPAAGAVAAINAHDAAVVQACYADPFTWEDHRHLRVVTMEDYPDVAGWLAGGIELTPNFSVEILRMDAMEAWGLVCLNRQAGTTRDGTSFETFTLSCSCWDDDGRIALASIYDPEDIGPAVARLQAAAPGTGSGDGAQRQPQQPDDPLAIPHNLAVRSVAEPGWELLAALGEHLCLHDTGQRLILHEVDDAGEVIAALTFDRADRRGAATVHTERYYQRNDLPPSVGDFTRALHAHDLAGVRAAMTDDCLIEDHREFRVLDLRTADDYVALLASAIALAPDYCPEPVRSHRLEPWGNVTLNHGHGTTTDGAPFELVVLSYVGWDDDGRLCTLALYEPEDVDAALARLAADAPDATEIERQPLRRDPLGIPRNLAVRTVAQPGWQLLAALGDHTCLHDTGDRLVVHQVDDTGGVTTTLAFHHADRRDAWNELLRLANASIPGMPERAGSMVWAANAHDLVALRASMADECVFEDHRQLRISTPATPDEYVDVIAAGLELSQDHLIEVLRWNGTGPSGGVTLSRISGTTTEGAPFEAYYLTCARWDGEGRVTLIAFYDPEDLDAALARYDGTWDS